MKKNFKLQPIDLSKTRFYNCSIFVDSVNNAIKWVEIALPNDGSIVITKNGHEDFCSLAGVYQLVGSYEDKHQSSTIIVSSDAEIAHFFKVNKDPINALQEFLNKRTQVESIEEYSKMANVSIEHGVTSERFLLYDRITTVFYYKDSHFDWAVTINEIVLHNEEVHQLHSKLLNYFLSTVQQHYDVYKEYYDKSETLRIDDAYNNREGYEDDKGLSISMANEGVIGVYHEWHDFESHIDLKYTFNIIAHLLTPLENGNILLLERMGLSMGTNEGMTAFQSFLSKNNIEKWKFILSSEYNFA